MSERALVLREVRPISHHQTLGIHEPAALPRLLLPQARLHHGGDEKLGNAGVRSSGAEEQHAFFGQASARQALCCVEPRETHGTGTLNVVVEGAQAMTIVRKQAKRVGVGEVLELQEHTREVAAAVATAVADVAYSQGCARHDRPADLANHIHESMYRASYSEALQA